MTSLWPWLAVAGVGALHGLNPATGWTWAAARGVRMLVPALIPLCLGDSPAREITASGSVALAFAAVGVHAAAMLAVTGLVAAGVVSASMRLPGCFEATGNLAPPPGP